MVASTLEAALFIDLSLSFYFLGGYRNASLKTGFHLFTFIKVSRKEGGFSNLGNFTLFFKSFSLLTEAGVS